ncbi:hypothetical protein MASR2M117_13870 [Paludibacter sp.]
MKKLFALIIFIQCIFLSFSQTRSFKRGLGYNTLLTEDVQALSPGMSWGYNWGHTGSGNDAAFNTYNIEFIPMAWNGINKDGIRSLLSNHPEIKYILGFNEPNFKAQANLSPEAAAAKWKDIEEIADEFGLTIVGPAVNYSPDAPYQDPLKWYDDFFAACPTCRVDHIAIHLYMSSASAIKSNVEKFKKYGKPIWLTEFCAWDPNTTAASQQRFLFETIDYLETDPSVYRYAWFKERGWSGGHPYMQLLDRRNEGVLLPLGQIYTYMSSYDDNFYFSTNQKIPAAQYIRMKGIMLEPTTDSSQHLNIKDFDPTYDYVDYNINIPETGEYEINFRYADQYGDVSEVRVSVNDIEKATMIFVNKGLDVWSEQSCKATLEAGKQRIRINFKQGGLKLNWLEIKKNASSAVNAVDENQIIQVYPNPATEFIRVAITSETKKITISSLDGKIISEYPLDRAYEGIYQISLNELNKGIYFINIVDEKRSSFKPTKLIVR